MAWRRVGRGGGHQVGRSVSFQAWVSARVCQSISVSICLQRFFSSLDADGDGALTLTLTSTSILSLGLTLTRTLTLSLTLTLLLNQTLSLALTRRTLARRVCARLACRLPAAAPNRQHRGDGGGGIGGGGGVGGGGGRVLRSGRRWRGGGTRTLRCDGHAARRDD